MARTNDMVAWIRDQSTAITKVYERIEIALIRLSKKTSRARVHQARVALRHLFALWPILCEDGWQTKSFEKRVMKPLDKLLNELGSVRNNDVNISIAKELECPHSLMKKWRNKRQKSNRKLTKHVAAMDIKTLLKEMKAFFSKQPKTVSQRIAKSSLAKEKPAKHV
ncbi:MAG: CHAD domain-containing protein, partial [Candidatus Obscuribacterales bacterium]|nr:CHAD domain-containing protein [Candidatus Obscuribacterales bacterium]